MNNQKKVLLVLLGAIILTVPLQAMRKRRHGSAGSPEAEILVPATPPSSDSELERVEEDYYVPGSPQEHEHATLKATHDAMRKQKLNEQRKKRAAELAKKKAAAQSKPRTKKPKKDD